LGQKLLVRQRMPCELENCHGGKSNFWTKVQVFFYTQLHITISVLPYIKLG